MGSGKKVTVGFRYYFRIHMGWCRGPVDELVEIKVGDRTAWSGSVTASSTISIAAPKLFGGDKGEGGIDGTLDVMMGEPTQAVNPNLVPMHGGGGPDAPAFRGVFTCLYDGLVTSMNPYPKLWKSRLRRAGAGWDGAAFYPAKAVISLSGGMIKAMNPAHILYECLTNRDWGRGLSAARLDVASYTAAADALSAEGFGLCLRWARQDRLSAFMQIVLDHIGAAQFVHRVTGLITLRLIRKDYTVASLPLFTADTGLLAIDDDDNAATSAAINEQIIGWHDPIKNEPHQSRAQNLALINATGKVVSDTTDYPGLPTAELAARIAQRDLVSASAGLKRFKITVDRRGYQIEPGGVFRISAPERGIGEIVLRAGRIEDGTLAEGAITITAVQDIFGMPASSFIGVQPPGWTPPNTTPAAITARGIMEIPYRDLARNLSGGDLAAVASTAGYLAAWGARPTSLSMSYTLQSRVGTAAYADRASGDFPPNGLLVAAMTRTTTAITLSGFADLDAVEIGTAALIDNEIVRVDAINPTTGAVTVARGCADTVPATHALGARLWFYDGFPAADPTEYASGITVNARLLTHTSSGDLDPSLAAVDNLLMAQRQYRPYPPGKLRINTAAYPATISGALALTWTHRDRLLQDDQLIDTEYASVGPEVGQTYTLRLYDETGTLRRTEAGLSGTAYTWSTETADSRIPGTFNLDAFDADSTASYTQIADSAGAWAVSGSELVATGGTEALFVRTGISYTDCTVECDCNYAYDGGLVLRVVDSANYYLLKLSDDSGAAPSVNLRIWKRVAGAFTAIGTSVNTTWVRGTSKTIRFQVVGSVLTASIDGAVIITVIDTDLAGAGGVGMRNTGGGSNLSKYQAFRWTDTFRLNTALRIELESVRSALVSTQFHNVAVSRP